VRDYVSKTCQISGEERQELIPLVTDWYAAAASGVARSAMLLYRKELE
jgi:hypothetical protein